MDYYRERHGEVDFIVHVGPQRYLPVEVKYQRRISGSDFSALRKFAERFKKSTQPILVTKSWADFGERENSTLLPLPMFLLLFD
jgi:predicted AAA+ superfamily ATPase